MSQELQVALTEGRAVGVRPLARELGLSAGGLYRAVARGEVQAVRIGRRVVIPAAVARRLLGLEEGGVIA